MIERDCTAWVDVLWNMKCFSLASFWALAVHGFGGYCLGIYSGRIWEVRS